MTFLHIYSVFGVILRRGVATTQHTARIVLPPAGAG